ncbi:MAG TPA: hypothetical protein VMS37_33895 [Verrucomicrobiae bacterium]|nr:hypothetical protein [Verrucomicrobiae bacterium]
MITFYRILPCLAVASALAFAQGPRGGAIGSAGGSHPQQSSTLAMTSLQTVTGTVTAVSIGYGMQYPSLTVNKVQIKVAPVWYLLEKNFEIKTGDNLSFVAAPSTAAGDPYLYAVEMTNTGTKAHVVLRDANGLPLWSQPGGGPGAGLGPGANADAPCEVLSIATESGVVEQVTAGPGIQMPSLTLKTAAGKLLVIKLGPERLLLEADLEVKAGDALSVKYAVTSHDGELVALAITKGGVTVTLRGDDGRPAWN